MSLEQEQQQEKEPEKPLEAVTVSTPPPSPAAAAAAVKITERLMQQQQQEQPPSPPPKIEPQQPIVPVVKQHQQQQIAPPSLKQQQQQQIAPSSLPAQREIYIGTIPVAPAAQNIAQAPAAPQNIAPATQQITATAPIKQQVIAPKLAPIAPIKQQHIVPLAQEQQQFIPKAPSASGGKKVILITGCNRGLGRALVEQFASTNEWIIIATARTTECLPDFNNNDNIIKLPLDLSMNPTNGIDHFIQYLINLFSEQKEELKINAILHNAALHPKHKKNDIPGFFESTMYVQKFSSNSVLQCCMVNALAPMELTGKLIRHGLTTYTTTDKATITSNSSPLFIVLAVSSWLGSITTKSFAGHYGYSGSKALLNMCIKGLSLEFARNKNGTAVALNPGWMISDITMNTNYHHNKTIVVKTSGGEYTTQQVATQIYTMIQDVAYIKAMNGKFVNVMDRTTHPW